MARLKEQFNKEIRQELLKEGNFPNVMAVPTIKKIIINAGVNSSGKNGSIEELEEIIAQIAGQKPTMRKARKAISAFKLREEMPVGVAVTLRGEKMWEFFDKLINVVIPRTKDFRGLSATAFDGSGNYAIGIDDHTIFPEVDTSTVTKIFNLQVVIVTSAKNNKDGKMLLDKFGFPFVQDGK